VRLEIRNIDVAYGRTQVLFGASLDVPDGSLTCLMGRNGVGKSTLLHAVVGLLPLRSGEVLIDGASTARVSTVKLAHHGVGYVPQGHQVFPQLSTRENLQVVLERDRVRDRTAIDDALDVFPRLAVLLDRPAGLLSGGQAQQLAMARALVSRPKLLLLDEPTEGIQPSIIAEIEDAIANLHGLTGLTILLVEQYVEFALRLAQRYALMEGGAIVAEGATNEVELAAFADLLAV
jgi:urea transport system ATP-binding protein